MNLGEGSLQTDSSGKGQYSVSSHSLAAGVMRIPIRKSPSYPEKYHQSITPSGRLMPDLQDLVGLLLHHACVMLKYPLLKFLSTCDKETTGFKQAHSGASAVTSSPSK